MELWLVLEPCRWAGELWLQSDCRSLPQDLHQGPYQLVRQQQPGAPLSNTLPGLVHNRGQGTGLEGLCQNVQALFLRHGESFVSDVWEGGGSCCVDANWLCYRSGAGGLGPCSSLKD